MKNSVNRPLILIVIAVVAVLVWFSQSFSTTTVEEGGSALEQTLQEIEGVGRVKVYVHYSEQNAALLSDYFRGSSGNGGQVSGVLVVSEGAIQPTIQRQLLQVVSQVMEVPAHRVLIVPMRTEGDEE